MWGKRRKGRAWACSKEGEHTAEIFGLRVLKGWES